MRKRNGYKIYKAIQKYFDTADEIAIRASAFSSMFE